MSKFFFIWVTTLFLLVAPLSANAQVTVAELQAQINFILSRIAELRAQIRAKGGSPSSTLYLPEALTDVNKDAQLSAMIGVGGDATGVAKFESDGMPDWSLNAILSVKKPNTIRAILFTHDNGNEYSTATYSNLGKLPHPLVVFDENRRQLNTAYNQQTPLPAGAYKLTLYMQKETAILHGLLHVSFTDGTYIRTRVGSSGKCLDNTVWNGTQCISSVTPSI